MSCSKCQKSIIFAAITAIILVQYNKLLILHSDPSCDGERVNGTLNFAECVYTRSENWICNATYTYKQYNITFETTQKKLELNKHFRVRQETIEKDECQDDAMDDFSVMIIMIACFWVHIFGDDTRHTPPFQLQMKPTALKSIKEERPEDLETPLLP